MKTWQILLLILLVIGAVLLFFYLRRNRKKKEEIQEEILEEEEVEVVIAPPPPPPVPIGSDIEFYNVVTGSVAGKKVVANVVSLKYKQPLNKTANPGDSAQITGSKYYDGNYIVHSSTPTKNYIALKMPFYFTDPTIKTGIEVGTIKGLSDSTPGGYITII